MPRAIAHNRRERTLPWRARVRPIVAVLGLWASVCPASARADGPPRPPVATTDIDADARRLFAAIQSGDADAAVPFFLSREAYVEVKAVRDPTPYYARLLRAFRKDIELCGREHPGIATAEYVEFVPAPRARWIPPGKEANRLGYYARYRSRIRYRVSSGRVKELEIRVLIDHGGRWSISHLRPFK